MRVSPSNPGFPVLLLAGALALAGCASEKPPSLGDRILAAGASHQQLGEQWHDAEARKDEAEDDIRAAKKAIEQAEEDLEDAQEDLEDATKRLAESKKDLAEAEREYHRRFPGQATTEAQ